MFNCSQATCVLKNTPRRKAVDFTDTTRGPMPDPQPRHTHVPWHERSSVRCAAWLARLIQRMRAVCTRPEHTLAREQIVDLRPRASMCAAQATRRLGERD